MNLSSLLQRRARIRTAAVVIAAAALVETSLAAEIEIGPSANVRTAVADLQPGDVLVLRGGTYTFDGNMTWTANGTPAEPITIRAKAGERPLLTQATNLQNVIEIRDSSYLVVERLAFTGGSHGIRLRNSDYVTIQDCEIFETGDVAISANSGGTYEGLRLLRNHIHHTNGTGEGMYLGCNNDNCRVANSLVEGNYIHHTNRASVVQGDGIELKEGSYGNTIRDNVIHDTKYPGIIAYSTVGNGAQNVIEGNVIWNVLDNTVQMAADVVFRNNIVLGNVAMQSHQSGRPANIEIVHNTIITSGSGIQVRNVVGPILIANNAVYAQGSAIRLISGDLGQVTVAGNVGAGGVSGGSGGWTTGNGIAADLESAGYSGEPPIDAFPASGSALIGAGDTRYTVQNDFNRDDRAGSVDVGAYRYQSGGNPGWAVRAGFKPTEGALLRAMPPANLRGE